MTEPLTLELVHEVPGRVRARCGALRGDASVAGVLEGMARELPGFERVVVRAATGSVVIHYSLEDTEPSVFRTALAHRVKLARRPPRRSPLPSQPLGAQLIHQVRRWWKESDRWVRHQTRGTLDLRSSVPWVLLFLSLRQIATNPRLGALPWYNAFYYSLMTIMRYEEPALSLPDPGLPDLPPPEPPAD
jgi:hypothetical protein